MDFLFKMPMDIFKISKFFREMQNNILRDFNEIITMSRKWNFAKKSIEDFKCKSEDFLYQNCLDWEIFIDGQENFIEGIQLFTFVAIKHDLIVIFEPFNGTIYWGSLDEFFVNQIRTKTEFVRKPHHKIVAVNDIIPDSLNIAWFCSSYICEFYIKNEKFIEFFNEQFIVDNKVSL